MRVELQSTPATFGDVTTSLPDDLTYLRTVLVNVYFFGPWHAGDRNWALIDTGVRGAVGPIVRAARQRFGSGARPSAIILTHGHFDHVGAARELAQLWNVPIYVHPLELPYLTGQSSYAPPDPTVGGGVMATLSVLYPRGPVDLRPHVRALPADGSVPGMPGWRWVHTPGHTAGHISLFRDFDRVVIAGDAVVTTKQESMAAVLRQRPQLHGPPRYYTPDWETARKSVVKIAALEPAVLATGHGVPLRGAGMNEALHELADHFDDLAVPHYGRYLDEPALADERGVVTLPPAKHLFRNAALVGLAAAGAAAWLALRAERKATSSSRK